MPPHKTKLGLALARENKMSTSYVAFKENIKTVGEFIDSVNTIFNEWGIKNNIGHVIFRGQPFDLPLMPSVYRKKYNEKYIYETFNSLYKNYTNEKFESKCELFSFMQHYGFPTRLLDWSENSLMSLYFSLESDKSDLSPVVWVLNVEGLNSIINHKINGLLLTENNLVSARFDMIGHQINETLIEEFFQNQAYLKIRNSLETPIAFYPISSGNPRIVTQKGVFTIHGTQKKPIEDVIKENNKSSFLKKITINKNSINNIIEELYILGVTPRSIYPDFEGLSKEIKHKAEKT